jgi:hypothetical protein
MVQARQATLADLDGIMKVEEAWPEHQRATADMMLSRLKKFPEGFWVFVRGDEVVGTLTSCPIEYQPTDLGKLTSWDEATHNGYLADIDLAKANALYLVSGVLRQDVRGGNTHSLLIDAPVDLALRLGLRYILAGAKMPGYDAYCRRYGNLDAREYAFTKLHGCLVDPFLEMYRGFGFSVPDRNHIIEAFYPDPPSRNYGAIVVRDLEPLLRRP